MLMLKKKHNELLKVANEKYYSKGYLEGYDKATEELESVFKNTVKEHNELKNVLLEREKKIDILNFFLRCTCDKDIARYEAIVKRTKKARIRKKAETKILEIKERKLAFE